MRFNYRERALEEATRSSDYGPYVRGEAPLPKNPVGADLMARYLFYLGYENDGYKEKAKEVSLLSSQHHEEEARKSSHPVAAVTSMFKAALYRDLSGKHEEALELWQEITADVSGLDEDVVIKTRGATIWVYQAYAYLKIGEYDRVRDPAMKGLEGIEAGRGTHKAPHKNSREYALVPLIIALAEHLQNGSDETRQQAQEALLEYKQENVRYGRHGYPVIFDLQFSYPDVLDPVLPSDDPEKD